MFAISPCPGLPFGNCQHRFHRDHHARLQDRVDILAQFKSRLAAIVVAQHTERMAVAKGAVLQQVALCKEAVDGMRDLSARNAGPEQAHPIFMGRDIRLPHGSAGGIDSFHKERALQRGVVAGDHREGIEAENITALQHTPGDRIVRAVGVDARLEPHPSVAVFSIGKAPCDLQLHGIATSHGHINLARANLDRIADGIATHIGHCRACTDQFKLCRRLVEPLRHRRRCDIHRVRRSKECIQQRLLRDRDVIRLIANHLTRPRHGQDGTPIVVPLPIRVGDIVAITAPPGLRRINPCTESDSIGCGHNLRIGSPKRAIEKARVIGDVVHRGQHNGINVLVRHRGAQPGQPRFILRISERQHLFALVETVEIGARAPCYVGSSVHRFTPVQAA